MSVNKPAPEAWAVMSDESKLHNWITGYKKSELISGEKNTVGAVTDIYIEDQGREMVMQETITKFVPNKVMAMSFTSDFMNMDYEISLEDQGNKTMLNTKTSTQGTGMISKSMIALMKGSMFAQEEENLNKLKKVIEENTTDYFPVPEDEVKVEDQVIDN